MIHFYLPKKINKIVSTILVLLGFKGKSIGLTKDSTSKSLIRLDSRNRFGLHSLKAALVFLLFASMGTNAQVTVTGNGAGSYVTLQLALAALPSTLTQNTTVSVAANNPQNAPVGGYSITTTGTSVFLLTITGNGNTVTAFTPQVSGTLSDAIFKIIGGDFITIQGFTMQENAANTTTAAVTNNMTEFGVALFYASTTNGAQYCTIQNNTITLNRTYQNTFGIYSNSTHAADTPATIASGSTGGGNSGLKIYGNTISNINHGILIIGATAAANFNTGIDIGGTASGTGNTISNFGTTGTFSTYANVSATINGILVRNSPGFNVSYNSITSSNGGITASATLRGIFIPSGSATPTGTFTNNINNNTIALTHGASSGTIQGITVEGSTGNSTSTQNINNNNFTALGSSAAATSGAITAISNGAVNLVNNSNENTFTNIIANTTGSFYFFTFGYSMPVGGSQTFDKNSIVGAFSKTGAGGFVVVVSHAGVNSAAGSLHNFTNNNFSNITVTGATGIRGSINSDGETKGIIRTVTGNTFNNWTGGTVSILGLSYSGVGGTTSTSTFSNNTITNITGQSDITGITIGALLSLAATFNVASNTIANLTSTGTGGAVIGLACNNASPTVNINGNAINTLSSTGAAAVTALSIGNGATTNVFQNKIYDISGSNASSTVNGLLITAGTTIQVYNNLIGNLTASASTNSDAIRGISIISTTANSTRRVYNNTIYLTGSGGTNFGGSGIFHTVSGTTTTSALDLQNNIVINGLTPNGTGLAVAFRRSAGVATTLANYATTSDKNLFYAGTPGANNLIYSDGTSTAQTMADYQAGVFTAGTIAPRDANSFTEAWTSSNFVSVTGSSANYLQPATTFPTRAESGGNTIALTSPDYNDVVRPGPAGSYSGGTASDIGAWEFSGQLDLTVTYDSQGGTAIANGSTATGGSIATSPGTPTRTGYTFNGWFAAATGGSATSFPYTHGQTANFTLYAQWTTVCVDPTSGGTIATAQSGNAPFNPAPFTSSAAASGETGTLEYKWQSSTTSSSADFRNINSTYAATYDAGTLTVTTWFKRLARVACSSDWSGAAESNVLEVTVTPLLAEPQAQPTHLFFTNSGSAEPYNLSVNYTASTTASGYLVVRKTATAPTFVPVDGTTYTAGAQGSDQIIYVGSASAAADLAVTTGTEYHYKIYAYGGSGSTINYLSTHPLSGKSIVKITNTEAISNTTQSVSAGFPTAGVNITFPSGTTGGTISAVKTSSAPDANFSALPGVRSVATQYFTIISTNAAAGNYTLTLDFSALGLSPSEWSNFIILKRADASSPWVDITSLGATILNRQTDGVWGKFTITGLSSFSDFSGGAAAATFSVTTSSETGTGSLKQAITDATSGDFISFDTAAMGSKTIVLTSPLVINKSLTILGANGGITLNGNGVTRVMAISDAVVVRLDRLKIENGSGSTGLAGGIWNNGNLTMVNCVVSGNAETGDYGAGGILQYSGGTDNQADVLNLINCTLTGNSGFTTVGDKGIGGLSVRNGTANIYNTIIYGNTGDGSSDVDKRFTVAVIDHSNIGNLAELTITTAAGNISSDPGFAGVANAAHPYAIGAASPSADAGSNAWCLETTDIRGGSFGRKINKTIGTAGTIDMGAYEFTTNTWTGITNNNFNTATNWLLGTVPTASETFTISTGNPQLNVDYAVGGTMTLSSTGTLTINAGKTLSVALGGTADFGGRSVTIKSDATGTGAIGQITGTLTGASNVTVERYIATAKRAWRMLSLPVTGTTIRNAWGGVTANGNAPTGETAGSGTLITGHGVTYSNGTLAAAAGYDWYTGLTANSVSSIRFYNDANVWSSATNTPGMFTTPDKYGYMVFIRGDRTVSTGSGTTTLKPTGTLKTGTQTMAISNAYEIIGNPYASSINLDAVYNNGSNSSVIGRNFWVWDATLGTGGAYRTLSWNSSGYDMAGGGGLATDYLKVQLGQAFFVEKTTTGNITIEESNKTGNASVVLLGAEPVNTVGKLVIGLYQATGSTLTSEMDGVLARFGSAFQMAPTDDYDVAKISNFNENMGLLRGNSYLSIESRPYPVKTDTLFAPFWNLTNRAYALKLSSTGINGQLQGAKLLDAFTKTETALNLNEGGTITYPFSVTSDAASSSLDRFIIVMTVPTSLPVSFTSVNATPITTGIDVTWKTGTEINVKDYIVERSGDGLNFTALNNKAAMNATAGAAYNYLDLQPLTGKNYYRIRSNDKGGDYHYSAIATAQWNGKAGMGVFPTAVTQGRFTVQLSNQPVGNYKLALTNIAGRLLLSQAISHAGGSGSYGVKTGSLAVSTGVYQLTITVPDGQQQSFRLLISSK